MSGSKHKQGGIYQCKETTRLFELATLNNIQSHVPCFYTWRLGWSIWARYLRSHSPSFMARLGWLLVEGKKRNGRLSLDGIVQYTQKSPVWQYLVLVPVFIAFNFALFMFVAPLIQPFIVDTFFSWWPQEFNFQNAMQDPTQFSSYSGVQALAILYFLTLGFLIPLLEELYFRGYLLPRMEGYARKWAPFVNVVLFSIYHFYSPWENPIRILALLPLFYVVWRKKDIRFGIFSHVLLNMIGGVMILVAVFVL